MAAQMVDKQDTGVWKQQLTFPQALVLRGVRKGNRYRGVAGTETNENNTPGHIRPTLPKLIRKTYTNLETVQTGDMFYYLSTFSNT